MQDDANPNPDHLLPEDHEPDEQELDRFLAEQDPAFAAQMKDLSQDKNLKVEEIVIDDATQELFEETQNWQNSTGLKKISYRFFRFLPQVSLALKKSKARVAVKMVAFSIILRNEANDLAVSLWRNSRKYAKEGLSATQQTVGGGLKSFKKLSAKRKVMLFLTFVLVGAAIYGVKFALSGRLLPGERELFIANFEEAGGEVFEFDPSDRQELFYDNVRSAPNLLLIPKMIINIKASANSGPNPMIAVEFFAEGMSPEAILELKAREPFFRDRMQRRIEDYSFDLLESSSGKISLTQELLKDLNRNLSQGQLRGLRIKTLVLKP